MKKIAKKVTPTKATLKKLAPAKRSVAKVIPPRPVVKKTVKAVKKATKKVVKRASALYDQAKAPVTAAVEAVGHQIAHAASVVSETVHSMMPGGGEPSERAKPQPAEAHESPVEATPEPAGNAHDAEEKPAEENSTEGGPH